MKAILRMENGIITDWELPEGLELEIRNYDKEYEDHFSKDDFGKYSSIVLGPDKEIISFDSEDELRLEAN